MKTIIFSLGGSIICPDEPDYFFLKEFKGFVQEYVAKGYRFVIMCGGGKVNSKYNTAAQRVSDVDKTDLDWIGVMATRLNAELVRAIFGKLAHKKVIANPTSKIKSDKPVIVAAGWKPGWSTDFDAVKIAEQLNASEIINLSNIEYIYDKDPRENKDARPLYRVSWKDYRKIVGDKWSPRLSTPFDPIASREAEKLKLKVVMMKGTDISNLVNYIEGRDFKGSIIS